MKRVLILTALLICTLCLLTGCCLSHDWQDATCEAPKTCAKCEKTEGDALGHIWEPATCEDPETCSRCQSTEGRALGHNWLEATTEQPKTCTLCNDTDGDRIITDPRFTTADTAPIQGEWVAFLDYTADDLGFSDYGIDLTIQGQITFYFANDGKLVSKVWILNNEEIVEYMLDYLENQFYAASAELGLSPEETDLLCQEENDLTLREYLHEQLRTQDFYASLEEPTVQEGFYYIEDGHLYTGYSWDEMAEDDYYLDEEAGLLELYALWDTLDKPFTLARPDVIPPESMPDNYQPWQA